MKINLTAIITAQPGKAALLKPLLLDLVANSTKEEACIKYELQQSNDDENIFIFHEIWKDQAGLDLHDKQPYLVAFGQQAGEILSGPVVIYKTQIIS